MGETAATEAKRRWNAEGAGMPPLPNHRKNKGRSCQIIGKTRDADIKVKRMRPPPEYVQIFTGDCLWI
jgi:hypothetical protein